MIRRVFLSLLCSFFLALTGRAEPLSRRTEIDFFRDVPSRNLEGLAARSDGRLVAGPVLTELAGPAPADLLWSLAATPDPDRWLVGTGPDGKILEITIDPAEASFSARELARLDESHVFALVGLPDGTLLAGTSPKGALCLVRDGKQVARVALPVDSIFDLLLLDDSTVLVATGNPGRIYRVDLEKFAAAPVATEALSDAKLLAERGITLFGEVRDRNLRRIARLTDGRIAAGSSPKGNLYAFARDGGDPVILQENRDGEVTDLLPTPDGGLYAALTFSGGANESRITPPKNKEAAEPTPLLAPVVERFGGRGSLVWLPPSGFPETLAGRANTAFYRIARLGDVILFTGGEQGEIGGFDVRQRLSLTYAGSVSSQLNGLAPIAGQPARFLVMRNNAPGFALLDFASAAPRKAETRRIDLGAPSLLGAVRFNRLRELTEKQVRVALKTSHGSDEIEGWSPWIPLSPADLGWSAPELRGRYVKLSVQLPADASPALQIDRAAVYALPQNRRPQLQDFRVLSPNFGLVALPEPPPSTVVSIGQLLQASKPEDDKRKNTFLGSQVVPAPGARVVMWTVSDPDGDNVVCTFSVRRDDESSWTDIALETSDPYVQFDTSHLADGVYFTRLVATETDPRRPGDRLTTTFETDDLVVDHTPPRIDTASAGREGDTFVVRVEGHDALSLIDAVEVVFNHGVRVLTEQPEDGILDSRREAFVVELPIARATGATSVEVILYDAFGNSSARRLTW